MQGCSGSVGEVYEDAQTWVCWRCSALENSAMLCRNSNVRLNLIEGRSFVRYMVVEIPVIYIRGNLPGSRWVEVRSSPISSRTGTIIIIVVIIVTLQYGAFNCSTPLRIVKLIHAYYS